MHRDFPGAAYFPVARPGARPRGTPVPRAAQHHGTAGISGGLPDTITTWHTAQLSGYAREDVTVNIRRGRVVHLVTARTRGRQRHVRVRNHRTAE